MHVCVEKDTQQARRRESTHTHTIFFRVIIHCGEKTTVSWTIRVTRLHYVSETPICLHQAQTHTLYNFFLYCGHCGSNLVCTTKTGGTVSRWLVCEGGEPRVTRCVLFCGISVGLCSSHCATTEKELQCTNMLWQTGFKAVRQWVGCYVICKCDLVWDGHFFSCRCCHIGCAGISYWCLHQYIGPFD